MALFATLPIGVVIHGTDGPVIAANASALEILGLSLAEITGKTSMDPDWQAVREDGSPFPGEQHPAMICLQTGLPVRDVIMGVTSQANRERRWIRIHAAPLQAEGKLVGAYACFEDITSQQQTKHALQASEARYRTVVESAPDAILIYVDQRVAMANPAAIRLFGASTEKELLGKDIWTLSMPRYHPLLRQRTTRALQSNGTNPIAEIELLRLDGTPLPVDGVSVAIEYQGHRAVHVMMRDATPRKKAEALLQQHRDEMDRVLALQVAHQTVAGIAHELNQPLNAVSTLAEAARRKLEGLTPHPANLEEMLEGIAHGAQRAGHVVHELLSFLKNPTFTRETVDLGKLAHEVKAQSQTTLPFAGLIEVKLPADLPRITGNTLQIEKILMNLLRNAVEACQSDCKPEKSGRIVIEGVEAGECVCLRVDDNGPGVPTDLIPRLFLPFVSSKPGGIGMGLPISQALARSLGGVLSYEAAPGGGARFLLTLPLSAETCSGLSL